MRLILVGTALIGLAAALSGCVEVYGPAPPGIELSRVDPVDAGERAIVGAALGTALGTGIGAAFAINPAIGAVIGAESGATIGAAIGAATAQPLPDYAPMPLFAIPFPFADPNAPFVFPPFEIGPLTIAIRWYALAYIAGLLIGWRYCLLLADRPPRRVERAAVDDFLVWATLGVVFGGRIGYVLFYKPGYYIDHPLEAPYLWHGGMSFHGGALG